MRAVPWADEAEQQLSRLAPPGCQLSADVRTFGAGLQKQPGWDTTILRLLLKFQIARQASSPILCASVRAVPWANEAEHHLSRLALSPCEVSADVRIFRERLPEKPASYSQRCAGSFGWQDKQAASVSVPLCEQCHCKMRLSNSFPDFPLWAETYLQTFAFS